MISQSATTKGLLVIDYVNFAKYVNHAGLLVDNALKKVIHKQLFITCGYNYR